MTDIQRRVKAQFGPNAEAYVRSPGHAYGEDLDALVAWASLTRMDRALDIATGGGHVALALSHLAGEVVATDLTAEMLAAAQTLLSSQGATNVTFQEADAADLPFPDASFDVVTCRIAAHHFEDPGAFVREAHRVLRLGGRFLLEDSVVPAGPLGAFMNGLEVLRDPSHIRSLTLDAWELLLLESGFRLERLATFRKRHDLNDWMGRMGTPAGARAEIQKALLSATPLMQRAFQVEMDGTRPVAYRDSKALFLAVRPGPA